MIQAVSIGLDTGYEKAIREAVPPAEVCFDPFHVTKLASEAVYKMRRAEWNAQGKSKTRGGHWVKGTRCGSGARVKQQVALSMLYAVM